MKKIERKIWAISSMLMVLLGFTGFAVNFIRIDDMFMNHFGWFIGTGVLYLVMILLGMVGCLSDSENP